jgi:hypothetical protein
MPVPAPDASLLSEPIAIAPADALLIRDAPRAGAEERFLLGVIEGCVTSRAALLCAACRHVGVPPRRPCETSGTDHDLRHIGCVPRSSASLPARETWSITATNSRPLRVAAPRTSNVSSSSHNATASNHAGGLVIHRRLFPRCARGRRAPPGTPEAGPHGDSVRRGKLEGSDKFSYLSLTN